jgi:hypothetical protein
VSIDVAQFFAHQQMSCILPLVLAPRSEPYELVTCKGAPVPPVAQLLIDELLHRRSWASERTFDALAKPWSKGPG